MAFGMFKKNNFADVIYTNGRFFTQTPDLPWVSAVACKDGRILSAGDIEQMEQLPTRKSSILKGNTRFPVLSTSAVLRCLRHLRKGIWP